MQNINRVGDATATNEGLTMLLESTVGIVNASMGYSLSITFLDIGPRGSMSGDLQYAHLYFKVTKLFNIELWLRSLVIYNLSLIIFHFYVSARKLTNG